MDIRGAFASFSDSAAGAAAKQAVGQTLGSYGLPQELNPLLPNKPSDAPVATGPVANVPKEDAQPSSGGGLGALWSRYRNLILIGAAVLVGGFLLLKRK